MKSSLRSVFANLNAHKFILGFIAVACATVVGSTAMASAAPDYFNVAKPSSVSQCYGGRWQTTHQWRWWHFENFRTWVPNWSRLGFGSQGQCIRYASTNQPTSKEQCENRWWQLGFASRNDCIRYLRLHPGNGYGGNDA